MPQLSLGTIEVLGLPAAVEAADVALKTADVKLIGYETTDGMGMVAVKIEGQVSAVQAAVAAASAAAARISKVFATSVIARPSDQLEPIVMTEGTVGLAKPKAAPKPAPKPLVEPVETTPLVSTSSTSDDSVETTSEPLVEPVETTPQVSTLRQAQGRPSSTSDTSVAATPKPRVSRRPAPTKSVPTKK